MKDDLDFNTHSNARVLSQYKEVHNIGVCWKVPEDRNPIFQDQIQMPQLFQDTIPKHQFRPCLVGIFFGFGYYSIFVCIW
jgi:hypothetical protein